MPAPGTTSDLYMEQDRADAARPLETPAPPAAAPATPTKIEQPVVTKRRMADETADGHVRDTSSEALKPQNDLGFRNLDDEKLAKPAEEKKPEAAAEAPKPAEQAPPEPPKVYAGKFKEVDALEKSYLELEKKLTQTAQEKALLERERLAQQPAQPVKTAEQVAAEQTEANKILNEFVQNPKEFLEKNVVQRTMTALQAQQMRNEWLRDNPDLAPHEVRIAFETQLLMQSDPELARNPQALLAKATENFRQFTGKIRTEGAKEALTTETRVIPIVSSTAQPTATEQPAKAPLNFDEAYSLHMKMLKEQEQRSHRPLR